MAEVGDGLLVRISVVTLSVGRIDCIAGKGEPGWGWDAPGGYH